MLHIYSNLYNKHLWLFSHSWVRRPWYPQVIAGKPNFTVTERFLLRSFWSRAVFDKSIQIMENCCRFVNQLVEQRRKINNSQRSPISPRSRVNVRDFCQKIVNAAVVNLAIMAPIVSFLARQVYQLFLGLSRITMYK